MKWNKEWIRLLQPERKSSAKILTSSYSNITSAVLKTGPSVWKSGRVFLFMTLWMYSGHRIFALWLTEVIKRLHLFRRVITLGINGQKCATGSLRENGDPVVWVRALLLAKSNIKSVCHIIKKCLQECIFPFYTYKSPSRHIYTHDSHVAREWPADVARIHPQFPKPLHLFPFLLWLLLNASYMHWRWRVLWKWCL